MLPSQAHTTQEPPSISQTDLQDHKGQLQGKEKMVRGEIQSLPWGLMRVGTSTEPWVEQREGYLWGAVKFQPFNLLWG